MIDYSVALGEFEKHFPGGETVSVYSAPGRTEICGNHCDHQLGCVIAAAVSIEMIAVVGKSGGSRIDLYSDGFGRVTVGVADLATQEEEKGTTAALLRGIAAGILKKENSRPVGLNIYVSSEVPAGSGVSSSAAFEVLIGNIFKDYFNCADLSAVEIAKIGQMAENEYFGKPSGLMDQMACSVGGVVFMDFLKIKNGDPAGICRLDFDLAEQGYSLCLVNCGDSHADLTEDYAAIPRDMKAVANLYGKNVLREVSECITKDELLGDLGKIREKAGDMAALRAVHFFNENERSMQAKEKIEAGDFQGFLQLVQKSGESSFKLLQNINPEGSKSRGIAIALMLSDEILAGRGASRVHGGGFAGTIQAFVPDELCSDYKRRMEAVFGENSCMVLKTRGVGGYCVLQEFNKNSQM